MSLKDTYSCAWEALPVTIASGTSLTGAIDLGGLRLFGIVMPSDWTDANLTFQTSADSGATWSNMKDQNGNEISAVASASDCIVLDATQFAFAPYLRVRSGTAASPVLQTATRTIRLMLRAV